MDFSGWPSERELLWLGVGWTLGWMLAGVVLGWWLA